MNYGAPSRNAAGGAIGIPEMRKPPPSRGLPVYEALSAPAQPSDRLGIFSQSPSLLGELKPTSLLLLFLAGLFLHLCLKSCFGFAGRTAALSFRWHRHLLFPALAGQALKLISGLHQLTTLRGL